jgi:hypothetical protein
VSEFPTIEPAPAGLQAERTARRLLGLACLLAVAACAILVVDFMIKQQIIKKAEEVSRELMGAGSADGVAGTRADADGVAAVDDAPPFDQGDAPGPDSAEVLG